MDRYGKFGDMAASPPATQLVNPVRGCGTLAKGGCYLQAAGGPGGTLNRTTWVLGTHVLDTGLWLTDNIFVDAPPRAMLYINPAATLLSGRVIYSSGGGSAEIKIEPGDEDRYEDLVRAVGTFGILDHVGSSHYPMPYTFAEEVWQHGPSRKVPEKMLRWLSDNHMFPIPVFFAHSRMPVFATVTMRNHIFGLACENLGEDPTESAWQYGPTWFKAGKGWGMTTTDTDTGGDHYLIPVLHSLSQLLTKDLVGNIRGTELFHQTLFLASWFTKGAYVLQDEDDPGMHGTGIININIDEEKSYDEESRRS